MTAQNAASATSRPQMLRGAAAQPPVPHRWIRTRDLLLDLIVRDIKLRYRGSVLGVLWTLLNPLAELLVLLLIFGLVMRVDVPNFPAYLFTGLIVYGWFQSSLFFATNAIAGNRELVRRPGVPVIVLPIVTVASNLVHFVLSLPILVVLLLLNGIPITLAVLALPLLIVLEFLFILGCAYPIAVIHVWFRDTQHLLRVALQLLFYLTPVFYQVNNAPPRLRAFFQLNPMAHMVDVYRAVLLRGEFPSLISLAYLGGCSAIMLPLGILWFRRASAQFADEL
jgi:lipopolysaccharide transport system permease protein